MVAAARSAWAAQRHRTECEALERVHVFIAPQPEVADWCARPANRTLNSCVNTARGLFESPRTNIYVREDVDDRTHAALVIHEVLHVQRGCWVLEALHSPGYLDRYHAGRVDQSCHPRTMTDWAHCDVELWGAIERDAIRRWEGAR